MKMNTTIVIAAAFAVGAALLSTSGVLAQQTPAPKKPASAPKVQTARVTVNDKGFTPSSITLKPGLPARVTFLRTSKDTCATEVLMPDYKVKQALPLNKPVVVSFIPKKAGTYTFACGMNMYKGTVVIK